MNAKLPRKLWLRLLSLAILLGLLVWVLFNQQYLRDEMRLYHYQPPANIMALASDTTMTPTAQRIFYVNHPVLADKADFVNACNTRQEQTIVLGCYHSYQAGIYVLDVTDNRLNGVEQVTAAHEMLHAAYDRLKPSERARVDQMLQQFYDNGLKDSRVKDTIEAYKQTEPNDLVNEMHSIFGTEVADLPADLEAYYQRYFSDRHAITNQAAAYDAEFTSRQAKVTQYDEQLKIWKAQIDSEQTVLQAEAADIDTQRQQLDSLRSSGDLKAYNAAVPAYNQRVDDYNTRVIAQRQLVNDYNQLVDERNALVVEVDQLVQAISTNDIPTTK